MSDILITEEEALEVNERLEELLAIKNERKEAADNSVFAENLKPVRNGPCHYGEIEIGDLS